MGALNTNGINKEQNPETKSEILDTNLLPFLSEIYPPMVQLIPPTPIITKDHNGILMDDCGLEIM